MPHAPFSRSKSISAHHRRTGICRHYRNVVTANHQLGFYLLMLRIVPEINELTGVLFKVI